MYHIDKVGVNMKQKLKKILILIILTIFAVNIINILYEPNVVYAETTTTTAVDDQAFEKIEKETGFGDVIGGAIDGVVGLLMLPYKLGIMVTGLIIQTITGGITEIGGGDAVWSVDGVLFNDSKAITSIDFFNFSSGNSTLNAIRNNVATWYIAMRNISIVILLGILLYVGIRMALATVGEQEAKYKKMLINWATSLALVFVLHYIMIFTIEINNALVDTIKIAQEGTGVKNAMADIAADALLTIRFTQGMAGAIIYTILTGVTLIFLFMYIKRMLTVGFLIIIAPLITITYSIDKMGDGKSQALNAWLKEFVFTILIQPFHCVIYVVFTSVAIDLIKNNHSIANSVLAIIMILFMFPAEKIIKQIFNVKPSSMSDAIANTAFLGTAFNMMKNKNKNPAPDPSKIAKTDKKGKLNIGAGGKNAGKPTNTAQKADKVTKEPTSSSGTTSKNTKTNTTTSGGGGNIASTPVRQKQGKQKLTGKDKMKKIGGAVGSAILSAPKNYVKNFGRNMGRGAVLGAAAFGLSTGSVKGGFAGFAAGKGIADKTKNGLNSRRTEKLVKSNQENFAGALSNYQQKFPEKSDRQIKAETAKFLNMSEEQALTAYSDGKMNDDEYEYWADVQKMKGTFTAIGDKDANGSVLDTYDAILAGDIEAEFDGIEQWTPPEPEPLPEPGNAEALNSPKGQKNAGNPPTNPAAAGNPAGDPTAAKNSKKDPNVNTKTPIELDANNNQEKKGKSGSSGNNGKSGKPVNSGTSGKPLGAPGQNNGNGRNNGNGSRKSGNGNGRNNGNGSRKSSNGNGANGSRNNRNNQKNKRRK